MACKDIESEYLFTSFTTPCPRISNISTETTPTSADIRWDDESETGTYLIVYSVIPGEIVSATTSDKFFLLDDLNPGTEYSISVAPQCLSKEEYTSKTFTTDCYAPHNLSADAITHTSAELSWDDEFGILPYNISYSITGNYNWNTIETDQIDLALSMLRPGTEYEVRVNIECPNVTPPYASVNFTTSLYERTSFAPNPTRSTVTIYPSKDLIGNRFGIYDEKGGIMAEGELQDYTFDFSTYAAGVYIINIEEEKPIRIVKQ